MERKYTKHMEATTMTVKDIYKCSNMMDNTKFVIDSDDGVTVYDGTWHNMSEKLKGTEILFFSINKVDKRDKLIYAKEVFVALKELSETLEM